MLNRITGNIASYDTRQTATFRLPAVSHEFARNCISYKFPLVFNNLEQNIKAKLDILMNPYFTTLHSNDDIDIRNQVIAIIRNECEKFGFKNCC